MTEQESTSAGITEGKVRSYKDAGHAIDLVVGLEKKTTAWLMDPVQGPAHVLALVEYIDIETSRGMYARTGKLTDLENVKKIEARFSEHCKNQPYYYDAYFDIKYAMLAHSQQYSNFHFFLDRTEDPNSFMDRKIKRLTRLTGLLDSKSGAGPNTVTRLQKSIALLDETNKQHRWVLLNNRWIPPKQVK